MSGPQLRVCMVIQTFRPIIGGAELQLERLLPHLAARGLRSDVLTRAVDGHERREEIAGASVRRTRIAGESPAASIAYVVGSLAHIVRRRTEVDVVHAHGALSPSTIALGARALGLPCLVTVLGTGTRGDLARLAGKPIGKLRSRLLLRWARFVALSTEIREELLSMGVPRERVFSIPNGVDCSVYSPATDDARMRLRKELGLPRGRFVGTFVGRLHPVKDVDTLLQAATHVPELDLVVVGDGSQRARLESLARSLDVAGRTRFVGLAANTADFLRASDAFFLSSHGEGMSNALMEAMACGLPCIATSSVGGVGELLGSGRGIVVHAGDVPAWSGAIGRLVHEPQLRVDLGDAAARFVSSSLSIEATADKLVEAYRTLAGWGEEAA